MDLALPGMDHPDFEWALEMGAVPGVQSAALCLKARVAGQILVTGPVVNVVVINRDNIRVFLEDSKLAKWVRVCVSLASYGITINRDWILRGETSVAMMGFFPKAFVALESRCQLPVAEFYFGFQYVRGYIFTDQSGLTYTPRTWIVDEIMGEAGLIKPSIDIFIEKSLVFGEVLNITKIDQWVEKKKKSLKKRVAEKVPAAENVQKETKKSGGGKSAANKTQSPKPKRKTSGSKDSSQAPKSKRQKIAKIEKSSSKSSSVPASSVPICLRAEDEEDNVKAVADDKVLAGSTLFTRISKYYTWGLEAIFYIPVHRIHPAPPRFCYRKLNQEHVALIAESMVTRPGVEPQIADLVPFNVKTRKVVIFGPSDQERRDFENALMENDIHFYAISGQHSARAAQKIIEWAKTRANLIRIASSLAYRKARILSAETPEYVLTEHSSRCNAINETMEYKSSFLDTVVHARRQFLDCGRPPRPQAGINAVTRKDADYIKFNVSLFLLQWNS